MSDLNKLMETDDGSTLTWQPEPGHFLIGEVLNTRKVPNQFGGESRIVEILNEADGQVWVVWSNAMLEDRLFQYQVRVGDRIGIKYFGKKDHKSRKGQSYHCYNVRVDMDRRKQIASQGGEIIGQALEKSDQLEEDRFLAHVQNQEEETP